MRIEGFTYAGIGISWYRHHFIGPGGHTRCAHRLFGEPAFGAGLSRIMNSRFHNPLQIELGMLGGSEVVNAKPPMLVYVGSAFHEQ